jgi:hypothetical protein
VKVSAEKIGHARKSNRMGRLIVSRLGQVSERSAWPMNTIDRTLGMLCCVVRRMDCNG